MSAVARIGLRLVVPALALVVLLAAPGGAGAFPGANGTIVFVRSTNGDLWTNVGASGTDLGYVGHNPMYSADGTKIAYDDGTTVYYRSVSGGSATSVHAGTDPAWSPDSSEIAYVSGGNIYACAVSCSSPTQLTTTGTASAPAWSPDGSKVAYVDAGNIYVVAVNGLAKTDLTNLSGGASGPTWSPDGTKIAYVSTQSGTADLYEMNADGSSQTRLTQNVSAATPSWSPDGTKIVFVKSSNLWTFTLSDSSQAQLTSAGTDSAPDWGTGFSLAWSSTGNVVGTASDGSTLTAPSVTPVGSGTITGTSYQWERCNSSGGSCVTISGETSSSYTIESLDVGQTIRVVVTATSSAGSASLTSNATSVVAALAPSNTVAPAITGASTAAVGTALTASSGTWSGTNPTYSYQWQRCDASGNNCSNLSGATSSSYTPVSGDVGNTLRVVVTATVTATNPASTATANSAVTAAVVSSVPANTALPAITGTPTVGNYLYATIGTWTGAAFITYKYQWQRCTSSSSCANVAGATTSSYLVTTGDVGDTLKVQVTGTNSFGSATATSDATTLVGGTVPTISILPYVSGTAAVDNTLTASTGTWLGSPTSYSYQWQRCTSAGVCTSISGASSSTYVPTSADVGYSLAVVVTAKNTTGSTSATSGKTLAVTASGGGSGGGGSGGGTGGVGSTGPGPKRVTAPVVKGVAVLGRTLVGSRGTWKGTGAVRYAYQWLRCPAKGTLCVSIPNATRPSYKLTAADVGHRLELVVTVRDAAGSAAAVTTRTAVVARRAKGPISTAAPAVTGRAAAGGTLVASPGAWAGKGRISYAYRWLRCSSRGTECRPIPRATGPRYAIASADVGHRLELVVTARDATGSASASARTAVVKG